MICVFVKRTVLVLLFDCTVIFYVYHCQLWFQEINFAVIYCCTVHTIVQEIVFLLMCTGFLWLGYTNSVLL